MQSKEQQLSLPQLQELRCQLGRRLRQVREGLAETQETFARRLGVTKLSLLKYEAGKTSPTCDVMGCLDAQGVDAQQVVFGAPSLAHPVQRARFATVHAWVEREFKIRSLKTDGGQIMDVAWNVFVRLTDLSGDQTPDAGLIGSVVQETLTTLKT